MSRFKSRTFELRAISRELRELGNRFDSIADGSEKLDHLVSNIAEHAVKAAKLVYRAYDEGAFARDEWWRLGPITADWKGQSKSPDPVVAAEEADADVHRLAWSFMVGAWAAKRWPERFQRQAAELDWQHYKQNETGQFVLVESNYDDADFLDRNKKRGWVYADGCRAIADEIERDPATTMPADAEEPILATGASDTLRRIGMALSRRIRENPGHFAGLAHAVKHQPFCVEVGLTPSDDPLGVRDVTGQLHRSRTLEETFERFGPVFLKMQAAWTSATWQFDQRVPDDRYFDLTTDRALLIVLLAALTFDPEFNGVGVLQWPWSVADKQRVEGRDVVWLGVSPQPDDRDGLFAHVLAAIERLNATCGGWWQPLIVRSQSPANVEPTKTPNMDVLPIETKSPAAATRTTPRTPRQQDVWKAIPVSGHRSAKEIAKIVYGSELKEALVRCMVADLRKENWPILLEPSLGYQRGDIAAQSS